MNRGCRVVAVAALVAAATPQVSQAQQPTQKSDTHIEETKSAMPYHPGIGELMTAFVQPRHIKLGLAGQAHNWAYAAYALHELREAFEDIAKLVPKHGNLVIPDAIKATVDQPMTALGTAIKEKSATGFTGAYAALTQSCNACHQAAEHPEIVIQAPTTSSFPDQDFKPRKP